MRLIDVHTLFLREFSDDRIPDYAALSHTWGEEEVSYQDMMAGSEATKQKEGYHKIKNSCLQAQRDDIEYIWIDTCCIDKSSSAELSEAINSMFRWYRNSKLCYAFMVDVQKEETSTIEDLHDSIASSRWFTRGWTLQELIAPPIVNFFTKSWEFVGNKSDLSELLTGITGIREKYLLGGNLSEASVAKRMSWAALRRTTRVEDEAYSLLGLFGVNMPLLYGEGTNAFKRLQEEIIKISEDQTIFAWGVSDAILERTDNGTRGPFAKSPQAFRLAQTFVSNHLFQCREPYAITNKGLHITLNVLSNPTSHGYVNLGGKIVALLGSNDERLPMDMHAIPLVLVPSIINENSKTVEYVREYGLPPHRIPIFPRNGSGHDVERKSLYIKSGPIYQQKIQSTFVGFFLPILPLPDLPFTIKGIHPKEYWSTATRSIRGPTRTEEGDSNGATSRAAGVMWDAVVVLVRSRMTENKPKELAGHSEVLLYLRYDPTTKAKTSIICEKPDLLSVEECYKAWAGQGAPTKRHAYLDKYLLTVRLENVKSMGFEGISVHVQRKKQRQGSLLP